MADKLVRPTYDARISSPFGYRKSTNSNHKGLDIAVPVGTPIFAPEDGEITRNTLEGLTKGYGYWIEMKNTDQTRVYRFAHLREKSKQVIVGQRVEKGQLIGYSGSTGGSTGPHLHFEIREKAGNSSSFEAIDPRPIYDKMIVVNDTTIDSETGNVFALFPGNEQPTLISEAGVVTAGGGLGSWGLVAIGLALLARSTEVDNKSN